MSRVMSTDVVKISSEIRFGLFGIGSLWFEEECEDWDTNTGRSEQRKYIRWRKATKAERNHYIRYQK